jgi:murein DD-endopeptidase MepM/ murein hydrolase activator NlpD
MATGTGPLAVNTGTMNTTDLTPAANIESLGDDWGRIAATFERFGDMLKPTLKERARVRGAEAGAAAARGEQAYKSPWLLNEINAEFEDAQRTAFMAGIRSDIDVREREIRGQYLYDPDGYRKATDAMVSGFVRGAPDVLAVDVESYGKTRTGNGLESVVAATTTRSNQEAVATVTARQASLEEDLIDAVALDGGDVGPEYERRWQEWRDLEIQKITNPLFAYTPEQSEIAEGRLLEKVQGSILTREAARVYDEAGRGAPGFAAARRFLSDAVDGRPPQSRAGPMTGFVSPVEGGRVSSGFGPRAAPVAGASTDHNGIDFAVPKGTPVKAAAPGVVVSVSEDGASGKFVRIRHPDGTISGYAHLDMQDVQRGQLVKQGDIIGASGSTGTTSGPHLHFTLSKDGKAIDPAALLDRPSPEALAGAAPTDAAADPILAEIPAPRRMRLYRTASANLDALYAGERATAQAEAAAEREEQAAEREAADSWRLKVVLGEASEADVKAATNIDDGTKASLITGVRARARSEASAARTEAAATRTASVATYNQYRDQAQAGTLPEGEIADAVQAGFLTQGQAQTLRTTRDRVLGPMMRDVKAPVLDAAKAPGRGTRGTAASLARADELVARWVRENPGATFEQRIDAGKKIAAEVFKPSGNAGGGAAAAQQAKLARLRALDAERKRTRMSDAEYRRRRTQIMDN